MPETTPSSAEKGSGLEHRPTDPMCIKHEPPRTWWQRLKFNRGRGLACIECRFGTRVTPTSGRISAHPTDVQKSSHHGTTPLPPEGSAS